MHLHKLLHNKFNKMTLSESRVRTMDSTTHQTMLFLSFCCSAVSYRLRSIQYEQTYNEKAKYLIYKRAGRQSVKQRCDHRLAGDIANPRWYENNIHFWEGHNLVFPKSLPYCLTIMPVF